MIVPIDVKRSVIKYIAPQIEEGSFVFNAFCDFIESRYKEKGTCVLCCKFEAFADFCKEYHIPMGTKEVIITNRSVEWTEDYRFRPKMAFHCKIDYTPKTSTLTFLDEKRRK